LLPYLQVLSDAAKRRVYDKYSKRGLETKGQGQEKEEDPFDILRKFYGFYG
jgi:DnaJ-class molecular chaperone